MSRCAARPCRSSLSPSSLDTVLNTRIAYADPRFARTSVMFNEWDLDKDAAFDDNYDTPEGVLATLDQIRLVYDQPDVSYLLMKRNLVRLDQPVLAQAPIAFVLGLGPHRRPLAFDGDAALQLDGLAASDRDGLQALIWSHDSAPQTLALDLTDLAAELDGVPLAIDVSDGMGRVATLRAPDTHLSVVVPAQGYVMLHAGRSPADGGPVAALYARHVAWTPRTGEVTAPHGAGAYEPRTGTLIASVDGAAGVGAAGVVLRDVPEGYELDVTLDAGGLVADDGAVLAVRVDYLKGDDSLATTIYQDPRVPAALPDAPLFTGAAEPPTVVLRALPDHQPVRLAIGADEPRRWGNDRRVMISLVVAGVAEPTTVTARLSDAP
ncbi:MAG: hypothetical protein R3F59_06785 [Myxococcota bacterium]